MEDREVNMDGFSALQHILDDLFCGLDLSENFSDSLVIGNYTATYKQRIDLCNFISVSKKTKSIEYIRLVVLHDLLQFRREEFVPITKDFLVEQALNTGVKNHG